MAVTIDVFETCAEFTTFCAAGKAAGRTIGLVPTMGALHEGHLSLVKRSLEETDRTVVTIFVNPTQFGEGEDLEKYPRTLESDLELLSQLGVESVFVPTDEEMYPAGFSTAIKPPEICGVLEGEFRPGHFDGVATVVLKLLNVSLADKAFFGQKDYQQSLAVRHMVRDLNVPSEIVVCPIIREADGLALSSRNRYLSDEQRGCALSLSRTLQEARDQILAGDRDIHALMSEMRQSLIDGGVDSIDYAVIANPDTLVVEEQVNLPAVALIAAHVGNTRLIDNLIISDQ
ncbi:MAG: pantoate--beta-alanine ligase [Planctomycetota bacterium]